MFKLITAFISFILIVILWATPTSAQSAEVTLLKQERNGAPTQKLIAEELASLGDPFFNLVLKEKANVTDLAQLENLIQPDASKRQTFVVDEKIADPTPKPDNTRRALLTFTGNNGSETLARNLMFSVFFNTEDFPNTQPIEAWGWDDKRSRYNYYKLDAQGTPGRLSWKFRGSSDGADSLSPAARQGTCMACHINGAPVMKELALPWDNWHSSESLATYLQPTASPDKQWPVVNNARISDRLQIADTLETNFIVPATKQFNKRRIEASLVRSEDGNPTIDRDGMKQVIEAERLLKPLFVTTEFNIISSEQKVGKLHPFSDAPTIEPSKAVEIPNSFFLNANLIGGSTLSVKTGLKIPKVKEFSKSAKVTPEEYIRLVNESGVKFDGQRPGDADFAWLVPEPSHIDNDMVEQLMQQGIVTPQFVAAVMAIDLETPILSKEREALLQFITEQFRFQPIDAGTDPLSLKRHPDELTQQVIAALEKANPESNSPAGKFLTILKSDDPLATLKEQVNAYHDRVKQALDNNETRSTELKRLYELAIAQREAVLEEDKGLKALDEFSLLFPLP